MICLEHKGNQLIGLGIVTYNRPDYLKQCLEGVKTHLKDVVDHVVVYRDGGDHKDAYAKIMAEHTDWCTWADSDENKGVAAAKNYCLKALMDAGSQYLFIAEDDIVPKDRGAIVQYIATSRHTGNHHLMFAHHGDGNLVRRIAAQDGIYEVFPGCVGAWAYYSRAAIEKVGYMDEDFHNAWEHVEHTHRIAKAGMTTPYGHYMDVFDSTRYLGEIPGSIQGSSIRQDAKWREQVLEGLQYWRKKDPKEFPLQHTIDDLEQGIWFGEQ